MSSASWTQQAVSALVKSNAPAQAIGFISNNEPLLLRIGIELFNQVLILIDQGKSAEARCLLEAQMNADEIIEDNIQSAADVQAAAAKRAQLYSDLEAVGMSLLPVVAAAAKLAI